MSTKEGSRADRWLWAVRAFKTRKDANDACRLGRVRIGGRNIKASRTLRPGDEVEIKRGALTRKLKVTAALEERVGAKLVPDYCEDLTPAEEYQAAAERSRFERASRPTQPALGQSSGRPDKRTLRKIREFLEPGDET